MVGCSGIATEKCKNIALGEADEWIELGYNRGMNKAIDFANEDCDRRLSQYKPPKNCMILIKDKYIMQYICKGDEYYTNLR